ncbi:protein takeout-like [Frankliniella occidentalis]|uniref:Protein takeout-like n=1 Tax=Frankliniella occidentalis TaxID=133901 RepID=A0A6J1T3P7_FRAOC|nr:protein takeout-like [Frankliniella occidentalis]
MGLPLRTTLALLLVCAGAASGAAPLFRCPRGPTFNACFSRSLLRVVRAMGYGDAAAGIPKLDPLLVPVMPVSRHDGAALNMNLTFYNMRISDITHNVVMHSLKFDVDNLEMDIRFSRPQVNFRGTYKTDGKILWLPVWGSGPFQMHMGTVFERYRIKGERRVGPDGQAYMHIVDYASTLEPRQMSLDFQNLFNGNWLLGKGANSLINSRWETIYGEIAPLSDRHFSNIMRPHWEDVFSREPLDIMFPRPTRYFYFFD